MPSVEDANLDAETLERMAHAERVVFVVLFSHWDTDWHETFPDYVQRSDQNILHAIQMAKEDGRFRYAFEQVLFVQHFWETHPEYREELKTLVQARQLSFAWAGITQPETSLVAPSIQVHNWQTGRDWIAATFGEDYVPHSAWQSDAFGNSAAFPIFLKQMNIPYLFIGRWQDGCNPNREECTRPPQAFYWRSPAAPEARLLVAYLSYPTAWDAIHRLPSADEQLAALRDVVEAQFSRTSSKYIFLPMGSDFIDPLPNLPALVDSWNAAGSKTILVMADPETAFHYLATQNLPEVTIDFNPIWQAFYASRPAAKIADKESEYFLTAADKFGLFVDAPSPAAWYTATINAHYDNIGAVSFDRVWESTQRPRFETTVAAAANDLSSILAQITNSVDAPVVIFNPTSWPRSEIIEIHGDLPDLASLPASIQPLRPDSIALRVEDAPPVGFVALEGGGEPGHPTTAVQSGSSTILSNGLVTLTLDAERGGVFSSLTFANGSELLSTAGDEIMYWMDSGDIYGARFDAVAARESEVSGRATLLASGPLIARAQIVFELGGQPLTKTVTLRADSALIEVALDIKALPETTALVQTPTTLSADTRTDDLGFMAFQHAVDDRPIASGDITYRRDIFYPIVYWSDVSSDEAGLTLITHGLQGVAGTSTLNFMLVRDVSDEEDREGVSDREYHTLRYAYLPHAGSPVEPWRAAYAFNQPLIVAWRSSAGINVQLPFVGKRQLQATKPTRSFPRSYSLLSAQSGIISDLSRRTNRVEALVLDDDPSSPVMLTIGENQIALEGELSVAAPIDLPPLP